MWQYSRLFNSKQQTVLIPKAITQNCEAGELRQQSRICTQCKNIIVDAAAIRCPRCNYLLLRSCDGNCRHCHSYCEK